MHPFPHDFHGFPCLILNGITRNKTNIATEHRPSQKETSPFSCANLVLGMVFHLGWFTKNIEQDQNLLQQKEHVSFFNTLDFQIPPQKVF